MASAQEGVIKFHLEHRQGPRLSSEVPARLAQALLSWRDRMYARDLIGQHPGRYEGAGFGNISARLPDGGFVITGTQTGGKAQLSAQDLCVVRRVSVAENRVWSHGPMSPSSEAMTHAAIYGLDRRIQWVFHAHSPQIWQVASLLGIPVTRDEVEYGTPAMAEEMGRLHREGRLDATRMLSMAGHLDGVISFGVTPDEAGEQMFSALEQAGRGLQRLEEAITEALSRQKF